MQKNINKIAIFPSIFSYCLGWGVCRLWIKLTNIKVIWKKLYDWTRRFSFHDNFLYLQCQNNNPQVHAPQIDQYNKIYVCAFHLFDNRPYWILQAQGPVETWVKYLKTWNNNAHTYSTYLINLIQLWLWIFFDREVCTAFWQ